MRVSTLPKSSLGRWSVGLAVAWILFFALSEVLTGFEVLGPGFSPALAIALTIVLAGIAVAAFVTGVISMIKSKERSAFVFVTTAIGLYGLKGQLVHCLAWRSRGALVAIADWSFTANPVSRRND